MPFAQPQHQESPAHTYARALRHRCARQDRSSVNLVSAPCEVPQHAIAWACHGHREAKLKTRILNDLTLIDARPLPTDEVWLLVGLPGQESTRVEGECLSPEETSRAARFRFAEDSWSYTAAHGLLRMALSRIAGFPPQSLTFVTGESGKPAIDPRCPAARKLAGIHFNISHTRGLVAVALARHEVGVDVERVRPFSEMRELVIELMSDQSLVHFDAAPCQQAQTELFMRFWTLSEAYLKATGEGLVGTTRDLEFNNDGLPQLISCAADQREWWQFGCAQGDRTDWLSLLQHEARTA